MTQIMFETFSMSAINVAIQSVLSLRFVTRDRHRKGLWRRHVAHCPYFLGLLIDSTEYLTKIFVDRWCSFNTTTAREFERCYGEVVLHCARL